MGRPTKLEGNPEHPASLGAHGPVRPGLGPRPLRPGPVAHDSSTAAKSRPGARSVARHGRRSRRASAACSGQSLRILTEPITSPSLAATDCRRCSTDLPEAKWHQWDAVYGASQGGAPAAHAIYRFDKADVVVSLDADFLGFGPGAVRYTKDFSSRRRMGTPSDELNRLYVVEPVPTVTGANADHRLAAEGARHSRVCRGARGGGRRGAGAGGRRALGRRAASGSRRSPPTCRRTRAGRRSSPAIISRPRSTRSRARSTRRSATSARPSSTPRRSRRRRPTAPRRSPTLVADMNAGKVDVLVHPRRQSGLHGAGGSELRRGARARSPPASTSGLYHDETAELCHWHVPEAHYLESWGDVRAFDGTVSLIQPLIAPLYDGRTRARDLSPR